MRSPRKGLTHNTTLFAVEKRGQIGVKKGETVILPLRTRYL
jgi:hypothetical protein